MVKRRALFDYHRKNADILIMLETHSTEECEEIWRSEWGGEALYSHGTNMARGVAVFTSKSIYQSIHNVYRSTDGRVLIFDLQENEQQVTIVAIYAPNEDSPMFFRNIGDMLKVRHERKIILGDFNLVLDVELDRENTYYNNNKAMEEVQGIMEQYSLLDIWRARNHSKREFSWRKREKVLKASRIDLALVSGGLDHNIEIVQYLSSIKTDHRAIYMVVDMVQHERGVGYWKLNCSLLHEQNYISLINTEIQRTLESVIHKEPMEKWEVLKERIKKTSIEYSKSKSSEDKLVLAQLSESVNEFEANFPLTQEQDKIYMETKKDFEEKMFERIQGVMFRSKTKWYEEGERNTKYFYSLEKSRYNAKTCFKVLSEQGKELTNPKDILEEQRKFYQELYREDQEVKFTWTNHHSVKVPEDIREDQNQQITIEELAKAAKEMNNNKTPGEDGIPVDFYKVFWKQLSPILYETMLQSYERKYLHPSARRGILNLIPKAGKDSRYIKNLRPITLLNTDYKIIEKAIANKLLPALEHIIHKDQRGFMKHRRISVNIRKMLDIIHQVEKEDLEAVILSLDFVKCFDKCSFSILHGSLDYFEFGTNIKEWTKILYKDFVVKIQNNGDFSSELPILKGVHQGGCCSSLYFLVIAEILAISLRDNKDIEGITIADIRNLLNQFADDMDIFSLCTEKSIKAIYEELDRFKYQSGFTVSYEKTTLYRIGSLRHSDAEMYNMKEYAWSNKDISVLGITIAHEDLVQKNYGTMVDKVKKVIQAWYNRGLTLLGKIQAVNTLISSLFVYKMMVLPSIPKNIVKNVDNLIRDYLWKGKKSKIAYNILQLPKKEGGLNLVNLEHKDIALKATWPQILKTEEDYAKIVYNIMRCEEMGEDIWRCHLAPEDVDNLKISSQFWVDVLKSWTRYGTFFQVRIENQYIWYNSKIRIRNKPFWWKDVYKRGLKFIYQLFSHERFKTEQQVWREFGLTKMRYNSLKSALPKYIKDFFLSTSLTAFCPLPPHNYDRSLIQRNFSKEVGAFVSDDMLLIHNKYLKWRMEIGDFCEGLIDFAKKHSDIYRVTNVTKYRSFQYRVLQRGLITNIQLAKWGIMENELCYFCRDDRETISHMLFLCPLVRHIWEDLQKYLMERGKCEIHMNVQNVITNSICTSRAHIANFMCLVTKQYIYAQRCLKGGISFQGLKAKINQIENIEKYIAIKNGKLGVHQKKWSIERSSEQSGEEYVRQYITEL